MDKKVVYSLLIYFGTMLGLDLLDKFIDIKLLTRATVNLIIFPVLLIVIIYLLKDYLKLPLFKKKKASIKKSIAVSFIGFLLTILGQKIINYIKFDVLGISMSSSNTEDLLKTLPLLIIVSSIIAPILEEIIFRRGMLGLLLKKFNIGVSIMISSLIFAGWHMTLIGFPNVFLVGVILSFSYYFTNRLTVPISIHILMNLLISIVDLIE